MNGFTPSLSAFRNLAFNTEYKLLSLEENSQEYNVTDA
jgi:hypothetical protein